jgi:hypothetical protein
LPKRPKIICSPSYADIRSRANTTRALDFDLMIKAREVVSTGYQGGGGKREGAGRVREGGGAGGRNDPSLVCTYE